MSAISRAALSRTALSRIALSRIASVGGGTAPAAPSSLSATNVSSSQVDLAWTRNAIDETSVRIERAPDSSGSAGTFAEIASVSAGVTTYSDTGLSASTRYWYRVRNRNSFGDSAYSNTDDAITDSASSWTDSGSLTGVTLGTIDLRSTFESAMILIPVTLTTGTIASATVEFRLSSGPGATRNTFPLWQFTEWAGGTYLSGSLLELVAGTQYDVRVTVTDNTAHTQVKAGQITTWSENISTPAALVATATRYVDAVNGLDTNNGTASGTPWQTLDKVRSAGFTGVVRVAPGWYKRPSSYFLNAIVFVAQYPAITDDTTRAIEVDASKHSIVYSGFQISPAGTTAQNAGKTLNGGGDYMPSSTWSGPLTNSGGHTYYKATGVNNGSNVKFLSFHAARTDTPIAKVAAWLPTTADYATVDAWVNVVYTNQLWNSGFLRNGNDLYMVPPVEMTGAIDSYWWSMESTGSSPNYIGFDIIGSNSRVCGFRFRDIEIPVNTADQGSAGSGGTNYVVDHCLMEDCGAIIMAGQAAGVRSSKHILQYNRWQQTNLASLTDPTKVVNWLFIKSNLVLASDTYPTGTGVYRTGGDNETSPFTAIRYASDIVVRHNSMYGCFNGAFLGNQTQTPGSGYGPFDAVSNYDVYGNYLEAVGDDAFEPEGYCVNIRVWGNVVVGTPQGVSMAPVFYGPFYFWRNTIYRLDPSVANVPSNTATGWFKITAQTAGQRVKVFAAHNTIWGNPTSGTMTVSGHAGAGGGNDGNYWYLRNNLLRVAKRYVFEMSGTNAQWDEDYNAFGSTSNTAGEGMKIAGVSYMDMTAYRAALTSGDHSNNQGGSDLDPTGTGAGTVIAAIDAALNDVSSALGDLSLKAGANIYVDTGTFVPNISDQASQYNGSAPDLGAIER